MTFFYPCFAWKIIWRFDILVACFFISFLSDIYRHQKFFLISETKIIKWRMNHVLSYIYQINFLFPDYDASIFIVVEEFTEITFIYFNMEFTIDRTKKKANNKISTKKKTFKAFISIYHNSRQHSKLKALHCF